MSLPGGPALCSGTHAGATVTIALGTRWALRPLVLDTTGPKFKSWLRPMALSRRRSGPQPAAGPLDGVHGLPLLTYSGLPRALVSLTHFYFLIPKPLPSLLQLKFFQRVHHRHNAFNCQCCDSFRDQSGDKTGQSSQMLCPPRASPGRDGDCSSWEGHGAHSRRGLVLRPGPHPGRMLTYGT